MSGDSNEIFGEVLSHFQTLLRFDTTNPPGNEREAIAYICEVLEREGLKPFVIESADRRANLVVRLKGNSSRNPLLINSHIDVVHAEKEKWKHPPFSGVIDDGFIWGRGAIDMKNMTAYCLGTMIALAREQRAGDSSTSWSPLKRDIIMTVVSDEETGGDFGMGFLAEKYPELIQAEYCLGELGGYTVHIDKKRVYPIQVGEKGIFWVKLKFTGSPGHGSVPTPENVHYRVARFIEKLEKTSLPVHMTESTQGFFNALGKAQGLIGRAKFALLATSMGPALLKKLSKNSTDPDVFNAISAMLTNTANPTGIESGKQHNVVPSSLTLKLDCRLLPGFRGSDIIREIKQLTGEEFEVEVVKEGHGHESSTDTPLFREMKKQLELADPGSQAVPTLTVGFTDAQHLKKFGTQCYGFTPIKMPAGLSFPKLYHGHNERIPLEGFRWGFDVFYKTVSTFCRN